MAKKEKSNIKKIIITFILFIVIICCFLLYSRYIATTGLIVKEYKIVNSKITDNFHGLKIVHFSDIHYGRTVKNKELRNLVKKINRINPDIVIFTGDLVDKDYKLKEKDSENIGKILSGIDAKIEKYAVGGNHDKRFKNFYIMIENAGFVNLENKYDTIYNDSNSNIFICGSSSNYFKKDNNIKEKLKSSYDYLEEVKNDEAKKPIYNILLLHEPDFVDNIDKSKFDLILAGHSHNGQVRIPFIGAIILPPHAKKYYKEYYKFDNTDMYISSGIGTSSINFRFFDRPSINFYRITKK